MSAIRPNSCILPPQSQRCSSVSHLSRFFWLCFFRFVFIMGTSIALSINSLLRTGSTRLSLLWKVVWRSFQLFLIGLIIINPNYCQGPCQWSPFTTSREFVCLFIPSAHCVLDLFHSVLGQPPHSWCAATSGLVLPGGSVSGPVGGEKSHRRLFSRQSALWF